MTRPLYALADAVVSPSNHLTFHGYDVTPCDVTPDGVIQPPADPLCSSAGAVASSSVPLTGLMTSYRLQPGPAVLYRWWRPISYRRCDVRSQVAFRESAPVVNGSGLPGGNQARRRTGARRRGESSRRGTWRGSEA